MKMVKLKNAGFSLIELLVTIAVMSIMVGGISISASLVFSKDASRCATILNDTLYSVRMDSMSKPGEYTVEIKDNNGSEANSQYVAVITCVPSEGDPTTETIYLEGGQNVNKIKNITATLKKGGSSETLIDSHADTLKITFDKSKGCVNTGSGYDISEDGIIVFHIVPQQGTREADVSLITATGKHTIGTY